MAISRFWVAGAAILSLAAMPAKAATIYVTSLSGVAEVPPVVTQGQGSAIMVVDSALASLTVTTVFFGLNGAATGASLHCCAPAGSNAGGAISFAGFPGGLAGGYGQVFNLTAPGTYAAPFLAANGGNALTARATLLAGLASGNAYLNIRSAAHPAGELRGQMVVFTGVPEPDQWALIIVGVMLTGSMLRKQARMRQRVRYVLA
jgi:hypothetical protein